MFDKEDLKEFHLQKYYKGIIGDGNTIVDSITCTNEDEYYFNFNILYEKTMVGEFKKNIPDGKVYYNEEHLILKELFNKFLINKRKDKINKIKCIIKKT